MRWSQWPFRICSLIWPAAAASSSISISISMYNYLYIYMYILHSADVCASSSLPYLCVRNADVFNVFSTRSQGVEQWSQKLTAYIHRDMEAFPLHYLQPQIAFSAMPWRLTMPMPVARQASATWYMGIWHMYPPWGCRILHDKCNNKNNKNNRNSIGQPQTAKTTEVNKKSNRTWSSEPSQGGENWEFGLLIESASI